MGYSWWCHAQDSCSIGSVKILVKNASIIRKKMPALTSKIPSFTHTSLWKQSLHIRCLPHSWIRNELTESALRFLQKHSVFELGTFTHLVTTLKIRRPTKGRTAGSFTDTRRPPVSPSLRRSPECGYWQRNRWRNSRTNRRSYWQGRLANRSVDLHLPCWGRRRTNSSNRSQTSRVNVYRLSYFNSLSLQQRYLFR